MRDDTITSSTDEEYCSRSNNVATALDAITGSILLLYMPEFWRKNILGGVDYLESYLNESSPKPRDFFSFFGGGVGQDLR
jgi:hypothetical protein